MDDLVYTKDQALYELAKLVQEYAPHMGPYYEIAPKIRAIVKALIPGEVCTKCQGEGRVVTDRYYGGIAVTYKTCPDCGGRGWF